jgi:hypothetical protein
MQFRKYTNGMIINVPKETSLVSSVFYPENDEIIFKNYPSISLEKRLISSLIIRTYPLISSIILIGIDLFIIDRYHSEKIRSFSSYKSLHKFS